jgi:AraC-like DNA-binding protein
MSTLIRTDQVPRADRLDFVRHLTATTWVPMECHSEHCATSSAEFRVSGLGAMQVVVINAMPVTVRRTPPLISQADPDMLKMVLVCGDNPCVVEQDGRQAYLSAGDFAVYDTRRPYQVSCGVGGERPMRMMTFMFPPSMLPLSRNRLGDLTAVRVPPVTGLGHLTSQFLLQLANNVDHYSPAEAARLSSAALEVLATRLARELDLRDWGTPEGRRRALLTTVQAFIQQQLGDPQLSPPAVAAAHHISLLAQRPVAAIAARWGFSSAGDFSRAFRTAHGLPPAEYRRFARVVKGSAL